MRGTLYPDWTPPKYPNWMERLPAWERRAFAHRLSLVPGPVGAAQNDGLEQLVPIIAAGKSSPAAMRKRLGKSIWRVLHHATVETNVKRARLWTRFGEAGRLSWFQIISIRPCHLKYFLRLEPSADLEAALYAGQNAKQHQFIDIGRLYQDTRRMGLDPKPTWSLKRLKKEHDALALRKAMEASDPTPWAKPFVKHINGFLIERLISDRDFSYEGLSQRHCIAGYKGAARRGDIYVFRLNGPERATLAFNDRSELQIKSFANGGVSKRCRSAAMEARKAFLRNLRGGS